MSSLSKNNKRIAKNTLLLYCRMAIIMIVNLFTVRIILKNLGVVDYGIFNVVGGMVTMLAFLSNTTSTATQRFFSYSIGLNDYNNLRKFFSTSFQIFLFLSIIAILLAESIGLWFVYNRLNIPSDRMVAAIYLYQFTLISLVITFLTIPYKALIIAHEKMSFFAYVSIIEALFKVLIVYLLVISPFDKLAMYGALLMIINFLVALSYRFYCKKYWTVSIILTLKIDKEKFSEMIGFTSWNLFGAISGVVRSQGINILINVFFGPLLNAARGISYQIYSAINSFSSNFFMAVNPQIIKNYAQGNYEQLNKLIHGSAKMSFGLLLLISFPIYLLLPDLLNLWLIQVPPFTVVFSRLVIINLLVESLSNPLLVLAQASGKIKYYQIIVGTLLIMNLPLSWIVFKLNGSVIACFYIMIFINIITLFIRLIILRKIANFDSLAFIKIVIIPILICFCFLSIIITLLFFINVLSVFYISVIMSSLLVVPIVLYSIILSGQERKFITNKIISFLKR